MKTISEHSFLDLPEVIQDQIYRELEFEGLDVENQEEMERALKPVVFYLVEYDPSNLEDKENLQYFLKQKISNEGEITDFSVIEEIGQCGQILDPILVEGDRCCEGRHRIYASLKFNLPIRAYVY